MQLIVVTLSTNVGGFFAPPKLGAQLWQLSNQPMTSWLHA